MWIMGVPWIIKQVLLSPYRFEQSHFIEVVAPTSEYTNATPREMTRK